MSINLNSFFKKTTILITFAIIGLGCTRSLSSNLTYIPTNQDKTALKLIATILSIHPPAITTLSPWQSDANGVFTAAIGVSNYIGPLTGQYHIQFLNENKSPIVNISATNPNQLVTTNVTHYAIEQLTLSHAELQKSQVKQTKYMHTPATDTIQQFERTETLSIQATWNTVTSPNTTLRLSTQTNLLQSTYNKLSQAESHIHQVSLPVTLNYQSNTYTGTFSNRFESTLFSISPQLTQLKATISISSQNVGYIQWNQDTQKATAYQLNGQVIP